MAEHRPLGRAGGPRGEADERRVVRAGRVERSRVAVGQVEAGTGDHDRPGPTPRTQSACSGRLDHRRPRPGRRSRCGPVRAPSRRCWPARPPDRPAAPRHGQPGRPPTDAVDHTTRSPGRRPAPDRRPAARRVASSNSPAVHHRSPSFHSGAAGSSDHRRPTTPGAACRQRTRSAAPGRAVGDQWVVRIEVVTPGAHGGLLVSGRRTGTVHRGRPTAGEHPF